MRHQCHGGKLSEDGVRTKSLCKHETTRWKKGENYRIPVHTPSCEHPFELIKARLGGRNDGGNSGKNDHREERS